MNITLVDNWQYIVMIGAILVLFGLMQWNWFRQRAYALMVQAKRMAIDEVLKSGDEQEQWVVDALQAIPILLPIPRSVKLQVVRYLYKIAKDLCDNGQLDGSNL
jgi:hypothetical protein